MQKGFVIIVLLCCAAGICRGDDAPPAWVNAVDTIAKDRVLLDCTDNVEVFRCFIALKSTNWV